MEKTTRFLPIVGTIAHKIHMLEFPITTVDLCSSLPSKGRICTSFFKWVPLHRPLWQEGM